VLPTSTPGVTSPASPEVVDASAPPGGAVPGSARPDGAPVDSAAAAAGRDAQPGAEEEVDDGPTPGQEIPADELDEPVSALPEGADDVTAPAPEPQRPVSRPVESLSDVKALIAEGRRNAAISGLVALRRKQPDSAYIPYLLGNLYFEKRWWTDGMKSYQAALRNNPAYRRRAVLNKNVIRALGSPQTSRAATSLVLRWLGRAAVPYLRRAAQTDPNPRVRQRASALWRRLSRRR
jgi:serine/threonine-protein kinase